MITITAILKSKTKSSEQVLSMLTHLVTETRKEAACLRYDLHYNDTDFVLWEEWLDQEGLNLHNNSEHLESFINKIDGLIVDGIQVYKTSKEL